MIWIRVSIFFLVAILFTKNNLIPVVVVVVSVGHRYYFIGRVLLIHQFLLSKSGNDKPFLGTASVVMMLLFPSNVRASIFWLFLMERLRLNSWSWDLNLRYIITWHTHAHTGPGSFFHTSGYSSMTLFVSPLKHHTFWRNHTYHNTGGTVSLSVTLTTP